jgi:hypothetical protein
MDKTSEPVDYISLDICEEAKLNIPNERLVQAFHDPDF